MLYLLTKYPAALDKKAKTVQWQCKQLFLLTFKKYPCEKINTEMLFEEAILQVSLQQVMQRYTLRHIQNQTSVLLPEILMSQKTFA